MANFNGDGRPDLAVAKLREGVTACSSIRFLIAVLVSPLGTRLLRQPTGDVMAGQLTGRGPDNAFDGLTRLPVAGVDYAPTSPRANFRMACRR